MKQILHMRGDVGGMFLFFLLFFIGLVQAVIAWKRLNGLSLTGYPDRRCLSLAIGVAIAVGSCGWYFSRPGHFAYPDMEGTETLIILVLGLISAVIIQAVLSTLNLRRRVLDTDLECKPIKDMNRLSMSVGDAQVPAFYLPAVNGATSETAVLILHDYGGSSESVAGLAASLSARGHPALTFDLDGHGENPRGIDDPLMEDLVNAALQRLKEESGREKVSALGVGLGGTLAIELAGREPRIERAVAVDPPAVEPTGYPAVNSLRELGTVSLLRAFIKPGANTAEGKRISLARMLQAMPAPQPRAGGRITIIGTKETWLNAPDDLLEYTKVLGLEEPLPLDGNHTSLAFQRKTLEEIVRALKGSGGQTARQA